MIGERCDDPTIAHLATVTVLEHALEFRTQTLQHDNTPAHRLELPAGDTVRPAALRIALIGQRE